VKDSLMTYSPEVLYRAAALVLVFAMLVAVVIQIGVRA